MIIRRSPPDIKPSEITPEKTFLQRRKLLGGALAGGALAAVGPHARALAAAETRCPNFLITDVSMPMLNGIELSIQFRAIHPTCKILLISGAPSTGQIL